MASSRSHPSLIFALILIGLGVLLLVPHPGISVGYLLAHYWPLVLILWGLAQLFEFYRPGDGQRHGLGGGEIFLICLFIAGGLVFSAAYHFRGAHWRGWMGWHGDWYGWEPSYSFQAQTQFPWPRSSPLRIEGHNVDLTLLPGTAPALQLALSDTIHSGSQNAARKRFQQSQPRLLQRNGEWVLQASGARPGWHTQARLQLRLPPGTPIQLRADRGGLQVDGWQSALRVNLGHARIAIRRQQGDVSVRMNGGDASFQQVRGGVQVHGRGDRLQAVRISGRVRLRGDFSGDIHLAQLPRGVSLRSGRVQFQIQQLPGRLRWDLGSLRARQLHGFQLSTRDQDVSVRNFQGPLHITDRNGSIRITANAAPRDPVAVATRDGDIRLWLPADSVFQLHAGGRNISLHNHFSPPHPARGPRIQLQTTNGVIALRPLAASAPVAQPPRSGSHAGVF